MRRTHAVSSDQQQKSRIKSKIKLFRSSPLIKITEKYKKLHQQHRKDVLKIQPKVLLSTDTRLWGDSNGLHASKT